MWVVYTDHNDEAVFGPFATEEAAHRWANENSGDFGFDAWRVLPLTDGALPKAAA
jgi:hypothetical protein